MTTATNVDVGTWVIDPVHSSINFSVRHLMVSNLRGRFGTFAGKVEVGADGSAEVQAQVSIDSIDTGNEQRDGHLKSSDFFDGAQFPTATFTSYASRLDGDDLIVDGTLTLKGIAKPVTLKGQVLGVQVGPEGSPVAGIEAVTVLNRKDFGIDIDLPLGSGGEVIKQP